MARRSQCFRSMQTTTNHDSPLADAYRTGALRASTVRAILRLHIERGGLPPVDRETALDRNARNLAIVSFLARHDHDGRVIEATADGIVVSAPDGRVTLATVAQARDWLGY